MCPELPHHKTQEDPKELKSPEIAETTLSNLACSSKVIIKTVNVNIVGKHEQRKVRALIDDGSQRPYIADSLARELGLTPVGN